MPDIYFWDWNKNPSCGIACYNMVWCSRWL